MHGLHAFLVQIEDLKGNLDDLGHVATGHFWWWFLGIACLFFYFSLTLT